MVFWCLRVWCLETSGYGSTVAAVPSLIPSTAISYQHQVGKPVRSEPEQTVRLRISIDSWHLCWVSKAFLLLKDRYVFFLTPKVWSWTPVKWGNLLFFLHPKQPTPATSEVSSGFNPWFCHWENMGWPRKQKHHQQWKFLAPDKHVQSGTPSQKHLPSGYLT